MAENPFRVSSPCRSPYPKQGSICCTDGKKVYLLGGSPLGLYFKHVYILDMTTRQWTRKLTYRDPDNYKRGQIEVGSSCVIINDYIYIFGGWYRGTLSNSIYQLDLNSFYWSYLEPVSNKNEPMLKNKQGMVAYNNGECLLIFGGYGYPKFGSSTQPGANYDPEEENMWTNEIHLFNLKERVWIVPHVTGTPPKPCAAFSFDYIDSNRVLLFGGRQKPERVNEVHILDTSTWHWSGPLIATSPLEPWPVGRSFHTACPLIDPELITTTPHNDTTKDLSYYKQHLLVLWGNDKNGDVLTDSWILEIEGNSLTWKTLSLPKVSTNPRTWHTSVAIYDSHYSRETTVFTFGGSIINLFTIAEPQLAGQLSYLMRFGCSTLYRLCQRAVLSLYDNLEEVQPFLPSHILEELKHLQTIETQLPTFNCSSEN